MRRRVEMANGRGMEYADNEAGEAYACWDNVMAACLPGDTVKLINLGTGSTVSQYTNVTVQNQEKKI